MSFGCRTGKISWGCICYSWATYLSGAGEQGTTLLKGFCGIYLTAHVCQTRPLGFLAGAGPSGAAWTTHAIQPSTLGQEGVLYGGSRQPQEYQIIHLVITGSVGSNQRLIKFLTGMAVMMQHVVRAATFRRKDTKRQWSFEIRRRQWPSRES